MNNIQKELSRLNPWWEKGGQKEIDKKKLISRKKYINRLTTNKKIIDIITGARRVGKTSILYTTIKHLLKKIDQKKILYFTAEIRVLEKLTIHEIISDYMSIFSFSKKDQLFIFIDEIQDIPSWQEEIKYLYDTTDFKIFLSGSSSVLLKKQTAKLTGRFALHHILPLSFSDYLLFTKQKITIKNQWKITEKYLQDGGYPEFVLHKNEESLRQIVESTLYRDLLSLYGIRNPALLKELFAFLCDKITTPVSANRIGKNLKIDTQTAQSYLQYLIDAYLVYPLYKKGSSHRIIKSSLPKYYLGDTGILRVFSLQPRIGHLAENATYLHLLRNFPGERPEIFYDFIDEIEVDFCIKKDFFEVKIGKEITNPLEKLIYITDEIDHKLEVRQKRLGDFLLSE